jgi:hypothetical protein
MNKYSWEDNENLKALSEKFNQEFFDKLSEEERERFDKGLVEGANFELDDICLKNYHR